MSETLVKEEGFWFLINTNDLTSALIFVFSLWCSFQRGDIRI